MMINRSPNSETRADAAGDLSAPCMAYCPSVSQYRVLSYHIHQRAIDRRSEFEPVRFIQENLMRQHSSRRSLLGSHKCVEPKVPVVRKDVGARKNHRRMPHLIRHIFPRKNDLPAVKLHGVSSPNVSPSVFARRVSSSVRRIVPKGNGFTTGGRFQGISWTMPAGVVIVTGLFVLTTLRAIPLNCALAFDTEIVFIGYVGLIGDHCMVRNEVKSSPNQWPLRTALYVMPPAEQPSRQTALMPRP